MPCLTVTGGPDPPTDTVGTPGQMTGDRVWMYAFSPSARRSTNNVSDIPAPSRSRKGDFNRESWKTYSVGYSERINFETGGAANWKWRRMVVSYVGDIYDVVPEDTLEYLDRRSPPYPGQVRTMYDFAQNTFVQQSLCEILFQGQQGVDWADIFNAKLDSKRVRVIYDKVRHLSGGNNAAHWGGAKHYFRHGETIHYDEQESGDAKQINFNGSRFAEDGSPGGNLLIFDFFACANGAASNLMRWSPTGTYYWHER